MVFEHGWDWTAWNTQSCNLESVCSPVRCDQKYDFLGQRLLEGSHTSPPEDKTEVLWTRTLPSPLNKLMGTSRFCLCSRLKGQWSFSLLWSAFFNICQKPSRAIRAVIKFCPPETGFLPFLGNDILVSLLPLHFSCDSQLMFSLFWYTGSPITAVTLCTTCKSLEKNLPVPPTSMQEGGGETRQSRCGVTMVSVLGGQVNCCDKVGQSYPVTPVPSPAFYKWNRLESQKIVIGEICAKSPFHFLRNTAYFYLSLER